MKTKVIYKITNQVNQKIYIGQTVNPRERKHLHMTKSSCIPLRNSVVKYGKDNFTFEIICSIIPIQDEIEYCKIADEIEEHFIQEYQSHILLGKGYNVSKGGSTSPRTEEWKDKMSQIMKQKIIDGTFINNSPWVKGHPGILGAGNKKGFQHSEETKKKISKSSIGKNTWMRGKNMSDETKQKMSNAHSGDKNSMSGRKHSEETKKKMSEAAKNRLQK